MDGNILAMLLQSVGRAPAWATPRIDPNERDPYQGRRGGRLPRRVQTASYEQMPSGLDDLDLSALVDPEPAAAPPPSYMSHMEAAPNVLQALNPPAAAPAPEIQQAPVEAKPARRERPALLDFVGRLADGFATVGGAAPLYEPTLNAREDRMRQMDLGDLQRISAEQQVDQGDDEAQTRGNVLLGTAVRGLQAIVRANPETDISAAWPILARQAGLDDERAQALGQLFAENPQAIAGMAALTGQQSQYGLQPVYSRDAQGNLRAYQLGQNGDSRPVQFGEGEVPVEPLVRVDAGDRTEMVGGRSGQLRRTIQRGERPEAPANRNFRREMQEDDQEFRAGENDKDRDSRENVSRNRTTGGGSTLTPTQRGNVAQVREGLPGIERSLARVDALSRRLSVTNSGAIGGLIPGNIAGSAAAEFDAAQAVLTAQIRSLMRIVGSGADSNFETRLSTALAPSRSQSAPGRAESIRSLREIIGEMRSRADRLLAPAERAAPRRSRAPSSSQGGQGGSIPTLTPEQARNLPRGRRFRGTDGRVRVRD